MLEGGNKTLRRSKRIRSSLMKVVAPDTEPIHIQSSSSVAKLPARTGISTENSKKASAKRSLQQGSPRPTGVECRYATISLAKLHPEIVKRNDDQRIRGDGTITDSVMHTMLSQNTTDANKNAAWINLKQTFPTWSQVAECDDIRRIETAIQVAGLAKTRAERMRTILRTVKEERGEASLEYIRDFSDQQVKQELSRFKGLGPKTISCVLLFCLGRDEFPVDTHVMRITQKMGWVPRKASREEAYEYLNEMIPNDVKMDLHCLLVRHGKVCHRCAANGRPQFPPEDGSKLDCPLVQVSSWGGAVPIDPSLVRSCKDMEQPILKKIKVEIIPELPKSKGTR
eukprot:scaffold918_cov126-Cylindrotheca_fusiformis.AAC.20